VVEVDADLAVVVALVAEGVLDLGHAAILGRVEVVLAHRLRRVAVEVDLVVVEDNLLPAIAARAERKAVVLGEAALDVVGADEVGHGAGAGRAEGIDGRLGRLEEHVDRLAVDGVAVAVELGGGALGLRLEVAAVEVRLRDAHDRVAPVALRGHDLIHRDRRLGADLLRARVGQRRVVEVDADLAVVVALVAEGVLDLCGGAAIRRVEVVLAHRLRSVAVEVDLVVVEDHLLPADATRAKGEALVLSIAARQHLVAANEIRQSALCRRAEGRVGGLGRLEEHVRAAVAVQLVRRLRSLSSVVAAGKIRLGDADDRIAPLPLPLDDLVHRDRCRGGRLRVVRKRRVVQVDADLAVVVALVAEGVLHLGGRTAVRRVEVVLTHRLGGRAVEVDVAIVEDHLLPALAVGSKGKAVVLGVLIVAADEVRERALRGGAEGLVLGLGRLEEHVRAAVSVELVRRLRSLPADVAALEVRLRDADDRIAPLPLRLDDLVHRDRGRGGGGGAGVRKRRVVQVDAHLAVVVALVPKGVLDLGDAVVRCRVKVVLAHGLGSGSVEVDLVIVEDHLLPAHTTVEGKALVLGIAALDLVTADKV